MQFKILFPREFCHGYKKKRNYCLLTTHRTAGLRSETGKSDNHEPASIQYEDPRGSFVGLPLGGTTIQRATEMYSHLACTSFSLLR